MSRGAGGRARPLFDHPAGTLDRLTCISVWRRRIWMLRALAARGEQVRGALGFLHPFLSACINQSGSGLAGSGASDYGELHSVRDVYGDVILSGYKPAS